MMGRGARIKGVGLGGGEVARWGEKNESEQGRRTGWRRMRERGEEMGWREVRGGGMERGERRIIVEWGEG